MPETTILSSAIASGVLLTLIVLARWLVGRRIRRGAETLSSDQRRNLSIVQNVAVILAVIGLGLIWSAQLSAFALSVTAVALALVIATKELILCFTGGAYLLIARPFDVGDWIEWYGQRGEVMERDWLSTRVMELGTGMNVYAYTGRILAIPNSAVLSSTIRNENFRRNYVYHTFTVTFPPGADPFPVLPELEALLVAESAPFEDVARRYWETLRRRTQVDLPSIAPQVSVHTSDMAFVQITMTVFCPTGEAPRLEKAATAFLIAHLGQPEDSKQDDETEAATTKAASKSDDD